MFWLQHFSFIRWKWNQSWKKNDFHFASEHELISFNEKCSMLDHCRSFICWTFSSFQQKSFAFPLDMSDRERFWKDKLVLIYISCVYFWGFHVQNQKCLLYSQPKFFQHKIFFPSPKKYCALGAVPWKTSRKQENFSKVPKKC